MSHNTEYQAINQSDLFATHTKHRVKVILYNKLRSERRSSI